MNAMNAREKYEIILKEAIEGLAKKNECGLILEFGALDLSDKEIILGAKINDKSFNGEPWEWLDESNDSRAFQAQLGKAIMLGSPEKAHKFVKDLMISALEFYYDEINQDIENMIQSIELDNGRGF
jgi:hypothetical protein